MLEIGSCSKITSIPITHGLPLLRGLDIVDCLQLSSLPNWLEYCTSLQNLSIRNCDKLTSISLHSLASLGNLSIKYCDSLESVSIVQGFTSLRHFIIEGCERLTFLLIGQEAFPKLKSLVISMCGSLRYLSDGMHSHVSLEKLMISCCRNLQTIPGLSNLTCLKLLNISNCSGLTSLPSGLALASSPTSLTCLKELEIGGFKKDLESFLAFEVSSQHLDVLRLWGWPKLKSLPEQIQHLTLLRKLTIQSFEQVEAFPEWFGNLASLVLLRIQNCSSLMYLPSVGSMQCLTKLKQLEISSCPKLQERCSKASGPEWPKISHIPNIYFDGHLSMVEKVEVAVCIICEWACWGFAHQLEEQLLCHICKVANKTQTNSFVEEKLQNVLVSAEVCMAVRQLCTSIDQLVWSHLANVVGSLSSVSKLKCPPEQCFIFGIKSRLVLPVEGYLLTTQTDKLNQFRDACIYRPIKPCLFQEVRKGIEAPKSQGVN
ncbi:hypothetical protein ACLB2K_072259 [Fragaria x ananassa]